MVNLGLPITEGEVTRPIKSSFYYDVLKKSGKTKSDFQLRNKTSSYDKHFLVHTDITPTGRGNSYPHRKDFAWNLLYLKQSWGANLNAPKKQQGIQTPSQAVFNKYSRAPSTKQRNESSAYKIHRNKPSDDQHPRSAPDQYLPPLRNKTSEESFRSAVSDASGFAERKRRTTGSEKSRITLDSIPENAPLTSQKQNERHEASTSVRQVTTSLSNKSRRSRRSERSRSKMSRLSAASYASASSHSSELSRLESRRSDATSSVARSYREGLRASSVTSSGTRWDEHEGRPFAEKLRAKTERERKVANTIRPEVLKTLVGAVTEELNSRSRTSSHLDSTAIGSIFTNSYSVKQHHPFTDLKFEVEKSASTTRLRSSLYKTEEEMRKPTIFRSNLTETKKPKKFNPRYHGDITRPEMVDKHTHKHHLEGPSPAKWVPKVKTLAENGPWTTYEAK